MSKLKKFAEWMRGVSAYTPDGAEIPDPTPLEMPVGFERPPSLQEEMRMFLSRAVQDELASRGLDSFEDADDFAVDEDPPLESPWEDPLVGPAFTREQEIRSGAVELPDFEAAKRLRKKAEAVLEKYDKDGKLKPVEGKDKA